MSLSAQQVSAFLSMLRERDSGFLASDQQYLAAEQLMNTLVARGEWPQDGEAFKTLWAPVLCSSADMQDQFYDLVDEHLESPKPSPEPDIKDPEMPVKMFPWQVWVYGSMAVLVALSLIFTLFLWRHFRPIDLIARPVLTPAVEGKGNAAATISVSVKDMAKKPIQHAEIRYNGKPYPTDSDGKAVIPEGGDKHSVLITHRGNTPIFENSLLKTDTVYAMQPIAQIAHPRGIGGWVVRHLRSVKIGMMLIPEFMLFIWLLYLWQRSLELRRWSVDNEPKLRRIGISPNNEPLFTNADIRALSTALRRRRLQESQELNVTATVDATCRSYGNFTPVFAQRANEPEYLLIGERKNLRDHQSRLQDELLGQLRENDVFVHRYYFQTAPWICSDARGDAYSLNDLLSIHANGEVWLSLDASRCVDPVTPRAQSWWTLILRWSDPTLLSVVQPGIDLETRVIPPTRTGLQSMALDMQLPEDDHWYPSLLEEDPESWLAPAEPPEHIVSRLMAQLQLYLGEDGFVLLQAAAVYPAIAWNITHALAVQLVPRSEREAVLGRIAALPWFRHAILPDWTRVRLLNRLATKESLVRTALKNYLSSPLVELGKKEEALDIVPCATRRRGARAPLHDHVYLSFASGRRLDKLAVEAPRGWRRFLRDSVWLRAGSGMLCVVFLWVVARPALDALANHMSEKSVISEAPKDPKDEFVGTLSNIAEARQGNHPAVQDGMNAIRENFRLAADVMGVEDKFPTSGGPASIEEVARLDDPKNLERGSIVSLGGELHLVRIVDKGEVLFFGADQWTSVDSVRIVYKFNKPGQLEVNDSLPKGPLEKRGESSQSQQIMSTAVASVPTNGSVGSSPTTGFVTTTGSPPAALASSTATGLSVEHGVSLPPITPDSGLQPNAIVGAVIVSDELKYILTVKKLSHGIGEFSFGDSPQRTNSLLLVPFGNVDQTSLPIAGEFGDIGVHYFWKYLAELKEDPKIADFNSFLVAFAPCAKGDSYAVFFYRRDRLFRITTRFFGDCTIRDDLFEQALKDMGISAADPNQRSRSFGFRAGSTNVLWSAGNDVSTLEVFLNGSPTPCNLFTASSPVGSGTPCQNPKSITAIASFSVNVSSQAFGPGREGKYNWIAVDDRTWLEERGAEIINRYQLVEQMTVDQCSGGVFQKLAYDRNSSELVFIPDPGCDTMTLKYSITGHEWIDIGVMNEIAFRVVVPSTSN